VSAPARPLAEPSSAEATVLRVAPLFFLIFWSGGFSAGKIGVAFTGP
jgi:hypothetical protein